MNRVKGYVRAVDGVNIEIRRGETFGLVGESGSGKSTLGRILIRLLEPTRGRVYYNGVDITSISPKKMKELRRLIQMVPQDPYSSLHPKKRIIDIVGEPLEIHYKVSRSELKDKVAEMLSKVGLQPEHMYRYPHQFSGGQRQRIMIARALITDPEFLLLDEPTSALDVSVQARILNLLQDLKRDFNLTYLLITHDIAVVDYMSDVIGVMYLGKMVEIADRDELIERPLHPYTRALLSSIPIPDPKTARARKRLRIKGEPPSALNPPKGCRFHTRCPYATDKCRVEEPLLEDAGRGHLVACHYWREIEEREEWHPLKT